MINPADYQSAVPPKINVVAVADNAQLLAAARDTDMLVITKMSGANLNSYAKAIDLAIGGHIESDTTSMGHSGSQRLLNLSELGIQLGRVKYILIVGLGDYRSFHIKQLCELANLALEKACMLNVEKLTLVIAPHRLTENNVTLKGTGAILRCCSTVFAEVPHYHVPLELELLCSPQSKPHLLSGLEVAPPRCRVCTLPEL